MPLFLSSIACNVLDQIVVEPTIGPIRGGRVVLVLRPDGVRVELIQISNWLHGGPQLS